MKEGYPRCETCKYWGDEEWDCYDAPPGYKTCTHDKINDYGAWIDDEKPCTPDNQCDDALVSAWREMGAAMTGPRFGCVHHELPSVEPKGTRSDDGSL